MDSLKTLIQLNSTIIIQQRNLILINNKNLCRLISKDPKYRESEQIYFEEGREEIATIMDQFIDRISNDKASTSKTIFENSEWKSHVI